MNPARSFFSVLLKPQSYLNLVYLLLAFPLGVLYFVFLVTGLSVGIATAIIWVGLFVLLMTGGAWFLLAAFERWMARSLLREPIPPRPARAHADGFDGPSAWTRLKGYLSEGTTWTSLLFLLSKFPLGILSFVAAVTTLAATAACLSAPWLFAFDDLNIGPWWIDSWPEALVLFAFGLILAFPLSLHLLNGLAAASGWWARLLLSPQGPRPAAEALAAGDPAAD